MRYAFIGLGNLGRRLARNLAQAKFPLAVHDRDPAAVDAFRARTGGLPVQVAASAAEAARGADAVITCLPSPAAARAALEGKEGALADLAPGSAWIEMGTNDPEEVLRLAEAVSYTHLTLPTKRIV